MSTDAQGQDDFRNQEFDRNKYHGVYEFIVGALGVGLLFLLGIFLFTSDQLPEYWANVYVTIVGVVLTIVIIDRRNARRALC